MITNSHGEVFGMAILFIILFVLVLKFMHAMMWEDQEDPLHRRAVTPCPYCPNPDRDDNGNAIGGSLTGNCQWVEDKRVSIGSDAPCVCDHYGTLRDDTSGPTRW